MRTLDDILKRLPPDRRDRIARAAKEKVAALHLQRAREEAGISQEELASRMAMSQPALSRVEHRADVKISTIVRYIEAMGGELQISAKVPTGKGRNAPLKTVVLYRATR